MDMDISMDIHGKSVDMDMDMDDKFHIHGKPVYIAKNARLHVDAFKQWWLLLIKS